MGESEPPADGATSGSIVCLVGPTAGGKTGLAMSLARDLPLEIISLDSRQIYQGLRIGTAQPTLAEREACPHHLVDFVAIDQTYDATRYRRDFCEVYAGIRRRGNIPLVVGGAGFYLKALTEGFMPLPEGSRAALPAVRARINALDAGTVRQRLSQVDPASLARIHPRDHYRLRRALEIFDLTGRSMSDHAACWHPEPCLGLDYQVVVLDLEVPELDSRIKQRLKKMLAGGWVRETRDAMDRFGPESPGLMSIGYPEIIRHLHGEISWSEMEEAVFRQTRQYAKRQRTWFRRLNSRVSGNPACPEFREKVAFLVQEN